MNRIGITAIVAGLAAVVSAPAQASEQSYRIGANSETTINLDVCAPTVRLQADGDNDTDLDYWLYDNFGSEVHSDTDSTDLTFYTIQNGNASSGRCMPYRLKVKNYGDVYNQMSLTLTEERSAGGSSGGTNQQSYRIDADSTSTIDINICSPSVALEVRGDGDTDLDFWVYDQRGTLVHSDEDSTDITFATLSGGKGGCSSYELRIRNYGNVYNQAEVKLIG